MDETGTPRGRGAFRHSRRGSRPDYKRRLAATTTPTQEPFPAASLATDAAFPLAEQVGLLADRVEVERTAFQGVAVVALKALRRACYHEKRAAGAALSLAQGQKLQGMTGELEATGQVLRRMLSPQGAAIVDRNTPAPDDETPEPSWWFALAETLHVLDEGASGVHLVGAGQPSGSATRALSSLVARLLERHYRTVFTEAEQWLG